MFKKTGLGQTLDVLLPETTEETQKPVTAEKKPEAQKPLEALPSVSQDSTN